MGKRVGLIGIEIGLSSEPKTTTAERGLSDVRQILPLGFASITDASPDSFTDFIRRQDAVWRDLVAVSGVRLD